MSNKRIINVFNPKSYQYNLRDLILSSSKCMKNICLICEKAEVVLDKIIIVESIGQWFSVGLVLDGCISHVYQQLSKNNLKTQIGFVDCAQIN